MIFDAIIIGAGHNGLVTAAYLARAGKKVLVLERREVFGGTVVTESFGEGFSVDSIHPGGRLRPDIIKDLNLAAYGYPVSVVKPALISVLSNSERLVLHSVPIKAIESIKHFSEEDARRWPEFIGFMDRACQALDMVYATRMPRLPKNFSLEEGYGLAEMLLDLRLMGRKDMLALIRMLPMSAAEFLDEWFESEPLKAALASIAIHTITLGVMSAGTGYTFLHNWLNRNGLAHTNVGKASEVTGALAAAVRALGGEIRTDAEVLKIHVDTYTCQGVMLKNGDRIDADAVISAVDPKRTFLGMLGAVNLPPEFVWNVQSIKMRGSLSKLHFMLDRPLGAIRPSSPNREQTQYHAATFVIAPSINYLERAFDACKYGQISERPFIEITTSGNTASVHIQFTPYDLKNENWSAQRTFLEGMVIDALEDYFPNFRSSILSRKSLLPTELEDTYGATEGDINHGQLMLDQFLFMRPMPGWSNHRTPIDGLYLCGSGVHAGGGVSGASGRNAARVILRDIKQNRLK